MDTNNDYSVNFKEQLRQEALASFFLISLYFASAESGRYCE